MGMPTDIGIIDTMIGFAHSNSAEAFASITRHTKDPEAKAFSFPAQYMFKHVPRDDLAKELADDGDAVAATLREMDRHGIERGMIHVGDRDGNGVASITRHPDRFIASTEVDPNGGMEAIRKLVYEYETYNVRAVTCFPAATLVAINDKKMYPIYAKCIELGIAFFCCAGVPGPRLKMEPQRVELIDEVMYDFPELVFVTRHGCEPWTDLAWKLMLKWPGLHYSTSAFAPKYYPKNIVDYANTRGADKIIYAGYYPMGLSLQRIMSEMPQVPFRDEVWPKFLRENALRVLGLD